MREELIPKLIESSPELDESFSAFMMFEAEDLVRESEKELLPDEPTVIHWELNMPGPDNVKILRKNPGKLLLKMQKILLRRFPLRK